MALLPLLREEVPHDRPRPLADRRLRIAGRRAGPRRDRRRAFLTGRSFGRFHNEGRAARRAPLLIGPYGAGVRRRPAAAPWRSAARSGGRPATTPSAAPAPASAAR